jgi:hypothetical protein
MSLILQEIGIVVAMQQPNPNLVTAEFLQLSGIVPLDWQLAREPINNDRVSQLLFTNGVLITAEPNRIMFGENIGDSLRDGKAERDMNTLTVATIAQKYVSIFKLAQYAAVGINIRSYSPQASIQNATQYINHQLLADGAWQNYGTSPVNAALNLVYSLLGRELYLDIRATGVQSRNQEVTPAILFSGNFNYNLTNSQSGDNLATVTQIIANWQADLSAYCQLITDCFLSSQKVTELAIASQNSDGDLTTLEIPYAPRLQAITVLS